MAARMFNKKQALEREVKDLWVKATIGDQIAAEATLDLTADIELTSVATGAARNTDTFTLEVEAAAANTDDEVEVAFTGDADDIVCTVTPNDGTNNPANTAATGTLNLTADIILTSVVKGDVRNTNTFTLEVEAAAANTDDEVEVEFTGTGAAIVCTVTPNDGSNNPANVAATATLNLTADIILTSVVKGDIRNTNTFTLEVLAAAANPTDTILADFTGTSAAIVCTITPNDGTNNAATPVDLTTAELRELIQTGTVVGKTVTITDASGLRNDQTATGGDATVLVEAGEGDGVVATFADGADVPVDLTTAELRELIQTGDVVGKNIALTDASSLRNDQTATGGGATALANAGEGDGVVATFTGGVDVPVGLTTAELAELINSGAVVGKTIALTDGSSLRALQTATGGGATALANSGEGDSVVGTFAGGGASDPAMSSDIGAATLVRNDVGDYTLTLEDVYNQIRYFRGMILNSSAADLRFQLKSETVASTKTVRFLLLAGATPTDPANDVQLLIKLELKNVATF